RQHFARSIQSWCIKLHAHYLAAPLEKRQQHACLTAAYFQNTRPFPDNMSSFNKRNHIFFRVGILYVEISFLIDVEFKHQASSLTMSISTFRLSMMYSCLSGVFLPIKYSNSCCICVSGVIITGFDRISSPLNCPNSSGEISPSPLNRVISGVPPS